MRRRLVGLLVDAGDFDNARNVIKAGIAANPRNYQLLLDYVLIDLKATGVDAALATAEQPACRRTATSPHARALKGDIYLAANRPGRCGQGLSRTRMTAAPSTMFLSRAWSARRCVPDAAARPRRR